MTTAKQAFEATAIELSKVNAPTLKLYEFNYFINKAINQYVNKIYNTYDINQQTTDDMRVLKATAKLTPVALYDNNKLISINRASHEVYLPMDYLHLLNCICVYKINKDIDCYEQGNRIAVPATRLTADAWSQVLQDIYNRPSPKHPYYYINNVNKQSILPTNSVEDNIPSEKKPFNQEGTDIYEKYDVTSQDSEKSNFKRMFTLKSNSQERSSSKVHKEIAVRQGNASPIRCEIRYGRDTSIYELEEVHIDYIKVPQYIRLTQDQLDRTEDFSQILEFPEYVNQEIINELVHLIMEHINNPRLANHFQMTQSIARPTEQQQQ